jgi:DNA-binding FrmR family transcriptional regulator
MADETNNLVLEHLRTIRGQLEGVAHNITEMKHSQAGILQILASHDARLLRVEERLDRIERSLELVETPAAG